MSDQDIETLNPDAVDEQPEAREATLDELIHGHVVIHLIGILNNPRNPATIRAAAVQALGEASNAQAAQAVVTALDSVQQQVQDAAIKAMRELGTTGINALCEFIARIDTKQSPTSNTLSALRALHEITDEECSVALPVMHQLYLTWQAEANNYTPAHSPKPAPDPWAGARAILVQTIANIGGVGSLPMVESTLYDPDATVQAAALRTAGIVLKKLTEASGE
jgi:hypothetical protein